MEGLRKEAQLAYLRKIQERMERRGLIERTGKVRNGRDVWKHPPLAEYLMEHEPLVFEFLIRSDRQCLN